MDDQRVGLLFRAVRRRRCLTQYQVAALAKVSQSDVSRCERGHLEDQHLEKIRRIARVLEIQLPFAPRWRGGDAARLLDGEHAAIMEVCVGALTAMGWTVLPEYTFSHFGERGSVDIVGWHPDECALLIIEVKSRLLDLQDLVATLGRKVRVVPPLLAQEMGWRPRVVGRVVVLPEATVNRSVLANHRAILAAAFPSRNREVRQWLSRPRGALAGVWFLRDISPTTRKRGSGGPTRVRRPRVVSPDVPAEPGRARRT